MLDLKQSYKNITWDIGGKLLNASYFGKVDDNGRGLKIKLLQNSVAITPSTETLRIYLKKPDGNPVYIDAVPNGDHFEITLTNQVYAVPGMVAAELQLSVNGSWITSDTFHINASDNLVDSSIMSSNEFNALQDALTKVENVETTYAPRLNTVESQLSEIETVKASKAELQQVSVSYKESYDTLALLQAAYPTGNAYNHTVKADGMIYTYSNGSWVSTGVQANGTGITSFSVGTDKVKTASITLDKTEFKYNFIDETATRLDNKHLAGYNTTTKLPTYIDDVNYVSISISRAKITALGITEIVFPLDDTVADNVIVLYTENSMAVNANATSIKNNANWWIPYDSAKKEVTLKIGSLPGYNNIVISFYILGSIYIKSKEVAFVGTDKLISGAVTTEKLASDIQSKLNLISTPNSYDLVLPSKIPCVVGREMNVYYHNIVKNGNPDKMHMVSIDSTLDTNLVGRKYRNRFRWLPTTTVNVSKDFYAYPNNYTDHITKPSKFVAVPSDSGARTVNVLVIGDSKINMGWVTTALYQNIIDSGLSINPLGTRTTSVYTTTFVNKHEGRYGWTADNYCNLATKDSVANAFYNSATSKFDFSYYMTTQGYTGVDYVFINLGTNDVYQTVAQFITNLNTMITSIRAYNSTVPIIVGMSEGLYQGEINEFWKSEMMMEQKVGLIEEFDNRELEKIFLCPLYLNMDMFEDYTFESVKLSARDGDSKTINNCTDYVHQSYVGFRKNGDTMYYTLKYIESLS